MYKMFKLAHKLKTRSPILDRLTVLKIDVEIKK